MVLRPDTIWQEEVPEEYYYGIEITYKTERGKTLKKKDLEEGDHAGTTT